MEKLKENVEKVIDENTCILRIDLTDGVLFSDGRRYEIDFTK